MTLLRLFQHLLPRALAWNTTTPTGERAPAKRLRQYVEGLAGFAAQVVAFVDLVYLDLLPRTTRELATWEKQFALGSGGSLTDRRSKLAGAWALQGGQSPDYLQRTLHAAGFTTVYVHEWWAHEPGDIDFGSPLLGVYQCEGVSPWECFAPAPGEQLAPHCDQTSFVKFTEYVSRDPRAYIRQPLLGVYQCEGVSPWECFAPAPGEQLAAHCDQTLANDPGYLVNLDLTRRAPPPVPDDPSSWPYFLYLAGETFPDHALVVRSRIAELKELILRIAPAQQWIVFLVDPLTELEGFGSSAFGSAPFGA